MKKLRLIMDAIYAVIYLITAVVSCEMARWDIIKQFPCLIGKI